MAKRRTVKANPTPKPEPRSQDLPGMENRAIKALEIVADDYADVRDRRMALNTDEARIKAELMALMKKHHKTVYRRNGYEIALLPGEETLKVRVKKAAEDDDEPAAEPEAATDDDEDPEDPGDDGDPEQVAI